MRRRTGRGMIAAGLVLGIAGLTGVGAAQQKGRYKKEGANCVWNATDSGPNQCTPQTKGRFKKSGVSCVWDSSDAGDDQCRPKTGRFKKSSNACTWDAKDSGPDQCNPRQPK